MIRFEAVSKHYRQGQRDVVAVAALDLEIPQGQFVSIMGPSGSGKSTLLHMAGGVDRPTSGHVLLDGEALDAMSEDALTDLRRHRVGFVFQFFNLLPTLTVEENVALPRLLAGARLRDVQDELNALLDRVGLTGRLHHRPGELSGGEMQRAALARALIIDPDVVLADEPTGNLDSANGREVLALLRELTNDPSKPRTVMMVTHDPDAAAIGDRTLHMVDGRLQD